MSVKLNLRVTLLATLLLLPLVAQSAPVAAQDQEEETPGELAREGMERLVRAIELMLEMIPQYEAPEVLPNGDIIIRRKNPESGEDNAEEGDDEART